MRNMLVLVVGLVAITAPSLRAEKSPMESAKRQSDSAWEGLAQTAGGRLRPIPDPQGRDAFAGLEECRNVDADFNRKPSLKDAMTMLGFCLEAVSQRYGVTVIVREGLFGPPGNQHVPGMVVAVSGYILPGNRVMADLEFGIHVLRAGSLLLHPARVEYLGETASQTSSLQSVIDRCPDHPGVRRRAVQTAEDFVGRFGSCLEESGLSIRAGRGSGRERTIWVRSHADARTVQAMNGEVEVRSGDMLIAFRIIAYRPAPTQRH